MENIDLNEVLKIQNIDQRLSFEQPIDDETVLVHKC